MYAEADAEFLEHMFQLREIEKIGEGSFGKVYKAIDLTDGSICAVKVVSKADNKDFQQEIDILSALQHQSIVAFKRLTENKSHFFVVMELMEGGTLASRMTSPFNEELAASIMSKILAGVNYMHEKQIIHRDLKPDNILLVNDDLGSCKIADFGLSFKLTHDGNQCKLLKKKCGTILYMAPEQFQDKYYNKQVDSWSCGIIMYMLLTGGVHPLFNKKDTKEQLIAKVMNPKWACPDHFSPLARDLFLKLVTNSPQERYSVGLALLHPWITRNLNDSIPLTYNERQSQFQKDQEILLKFKLVLFASYIKDHSQKVEKSIEKIEVEIPKIEKLNLENSLSNDSFRSDWKPTNTPVPKARTRPSIFSIENQSKTNIKFNTARFFSPKADVSLKLIHSTTSRNHLSSFESAVHQIDKEDVKSSQYRRNQVQYRQAASSLRQLRTSTSEKAYTLGQIKSKKDCRKPQNELPPLRKQL